MKKKGTRQKQLLTWALNSWPGHCDEPGWSTRRFRRRILPFGRSLGIGHAAIVALLRQALLTQPAAKDGGVVCFWLKGGKNHHQFLFGGVPRQIGGKLVDIAYLEKMDVRQTFRRGCSLQTAQACPYIPIDVWLYQHGIQVFVGLTAYT